MEYMTKYIFITGGVVSSLGKGITISSIAALLKAAGYSKLRMIKIDPYLNVDPGTMNPFEHGEVFVTEDGKETDLDLGHYERFTEIYTNKHSNITSGRLYLNVIMNERKGVYQGHTVQIVPHLTDEIKRFIRHDSDKYEFVLTEIGGTIGDIEAPAILEAVRQLKYELGSENALSVHVTLVPYLQAAKELKTKPTQHSVKELMGTGIIPDLLICRTHRKLKPYVIKKIAKSCNVTESAVIEAVDVKSIYEVPLRYAKQKILNTIFEKFALPPPPNTSEFLSPWINLNGLINSTTKTLNIGIVGKYVPYDDAYISLVEALKHAGWHKNIKVEIKWINSREPIDLSTLKTEVDGIVVPGGFGKGGIQNKVETLKYCRENKIPTLGICLGMQLMILEIARNQLKIVATTEELNGEGEQVVGYLDKWMDEEECLQIRSKEKTELGGTMRLGSYTTRITPSTLLHTLYKSDRTTERHRHRYEVKLTTETLSKTDLIVSGVSNDRIPEVVECKDHPFYIGCQYHPEYKSTPFTPRPLFMGLISAANKE